MTLPAVQLHADALHGKYFFLSFTIGSKLS